MKRWIALAARLYPREWREQYSEEFAALPDDVKPGWRVFANVLGGALKMQMTTGSNWLKVAVTTAIIGAIVAGGISFTVAPRYVSSAVISFTPQPDPVRPISPQALRQRADERVAEFETEILSRYSLSGTVQKLDLYKTERQQQPLDDVLALMRTNIRIQPRSSTDDGLAPIVFSVSFSYPDQAMAQAAVSELAAKFTEATAVTNRNREAVYRSFWQDELRHKKPAPPPVADIMAIVDPASLPAEAIGPNRIVFLAWGLAAGLVLGLLAGLAMRRPRRAWQLAGFAAAGCVLAGAASFLIPGRYTSTAVMMITPTVLTEDPLAALPAVTPAAEFLRQMEPQVLSFLSLSKIIEEPRLNLYPEERANKPMEEVVRNMRSRDLRIAVLPPASGTNAAASGFSISFSYSDKQKVREVVQALMTTFIEENLAAKRANANQNDVLLRDIYQRKAGENLEVLDPPSWPQLPFKPNRMLIAADGLGVRLLVGAVTLCLRRSQRPTAQPA